MLEEIIRLLREIVDDLADVELNAETSLIASGNMDSFEVVTLIMELEKVFSISIDLEDLSLEDFETPGNIVHMIARRQAR